MSVSKRLFAVLITAIFLNACGPSNTPGEGAETGIEVQEARTTMAEQGENSKVFLEMRNHGRQTDRLTVVTSSVAEGAELYNGGEIVEVIPVDANTDLAFSADGYHVVLIGLKEDLQIGGEVEFVLHFQAHEAIKVQAIVGEGSEHEHGHEEGN